MSSADSSPEVPADSQGIVIAGPAVATFHRRKTSRPIWDRSEGETFDYFGELVIEGVVQIHTPAGRQYATWFNFDKRVSFVVRDRNHGTVQTSSHVDGGWNLARKGLSVQMALSPGDSITEDAFNAASESGRVISRRFIHRLDDLLPSLYPEPTTLEIHAEYLEFRSNTILVEVRVADD